MGIDNYMPHILVQISPNTNHPNRISQSFSPPFPILLLSPILPLFLIFPLFLTPSLFPIPPLSLLILLDELFLFSSIDAYSSILESENKSSNDRLSTFALMNSLHFSFRASKLYLFAVMSHYTKRKQCVREREIFVSQVSYIYSIVHTQPPHDNTRTLFL